jgi:glutamate-1-semialdehyde 2,1-aminomutase
MEGDHMAGFNTSRQMLSEAAKQLPGGVSSNYRLGISPTPLVFDHASGPYLYDVDGNRLIDYYLGMGPMILGHSPQAVITAVTEQLQRGILYAGQSEIEYAAARLVCQLVPCAEMVRFGSSGSEVVQAALRIARAVTGRMTVIKFEGHYHGWLDNVHYSVAPPLDQAGPEGAPSAVPGSIGQDPLAAQSLVVLPWNNLELLAARLARGDVAAVIMEPAMCNTSAIIADPGYLEGARAACSAAGTLLIFDEVITGFRVAPGGAQQRLGVTPDLATFGKAIANGFPVAALAGRANVMEQFVSRKVMHGGTYNAQPVSMAATVATLTALADGQVHAALERSGQRLMDGIARALAEADISARIQGFPQIFHVALGVDTPIRDYRSSLAADRARYVRLTTALLDHGVRALERGAWFLSTAHTDEVIDETIAAVTAAAKQI